MTFYKEPLSKIPTFAERDLTLICTSLVIAVIRVGGLVSPNEVIFLELTRWNIHPPGKTTGM